MGPTALLRRRPSGAVLRLPLLRRATAFLLRRRLGLCRRRRRWRRRWWPRAPCRRASDVGATIENGVVDVHGADLTNEVCEITNDLMVVLGSLLHGEGDRALPEPTKPGARIRNQRFGVGIWKLELTALH